ncbi:amino acid permease [Aetokthonos hydrillicola Thurmond2011]|uniref:Amino acid permease n=1 Tax=Aetokthonos hydrillicola Thurmond2011 TaxID=2712845 RepID=A0AAP5IBQ7_9CYAN|nr:amino acid permease [Aetokthonos hydrillicola]MBO3463009.1 amino acid permease [Aetokthonos hydrillicola CCALA 1050]MBW4587188.1 amino acid permease [Aetokthonos hydrillicola CCALA 1050]MDR9896788.1 amino acid permease [Aetokthonos hydrillicola Thurmond2011]
MNRSQYLEKKSVSQLQNEASTGDHMQRALGPIDLITLGIGATIGAGIFVLTGTAAAKYAGPGIVLSFILGGIACGFAGLCYAEFASLLPIAGSAYTYAYATLGELVAWIIGWDLLLEYALGSATVAVGWSGYAVSFLKDLGITLPPSLTAAPGTSVVLSDNSVVTAVFNLPAFLAILCVTVLLVVGVRESARFNNIIVAVKLVVILAFIGFGVWHINSANWTPLIPPNTGQFGEYGISGIVRGAGVVFFSYIGFDAVSTAAQEAKQPQRDMPIGIIGSLLICTTLYIVVAAVLTGIVSYKSLNVADPIAVGVNVVGLKWLAIAVKIGAICGLSSVMLVLSYAQTRILYSISKDGLLPAFFSTIHPRFKTPHITTIILGVFVSFLAGLTPISTLGELVSIGTLFAFTVVSAGVLFLRYRQPNIYRPFRCPLVPWVPLLAIFVCLYLVFGLPQETWLRLLVWLGVGLVIYFFYGQYHSLLNKEPR